MIADPYRHRRSLEVAIRLWPRHTLAALALSVVPVSAQTPQQIIQQVAEAEPDNEPLGDE